MVTTNKQEWNRRHGFSKDESHSKAAIARATKGVGIKTVEEVYDRGIGAYKTNPTSVRVKGTFKKSDSAPMRKRLSKEQWAFARVYSFVNKVTGPKKLNHDQDLVK
jgi:hypothetical protein